jgi:molybdenum cofactor biosynthesis protein B
MPHEEANLPYKPIFAIITVSTSRFYAMLRGEEYSDDSGDLAENLIRDSGIDIVYRYLVPDNPSYILHSINMAIYKGSEVILILGGSGISPSDVSYDVVKSILEEEITSYQDLFINFSIETAGSRVVPTRLTAGYYRDSLIFLMPGNIDAVKTALENIVLKEYIHLLWLRNYGFF